MRKRHQYRMLHAAFAFALIGLAFFAAYSGDVLTRQHRPNQEQGPPTPDDHHNRPSEPPAPHGSKDDHGRQTEQQWANTFLEHTPDWFVALFTLLLAYITWRLVTSTNKLWETSEHQIRLAREEFLATHRPKITVQSFTIADQGAEDRRAIVDFWIANAGESLGTVTGFVLFGYYQPPQNDFHPDFSEPLMQNPTALVLPPGARVLVRTECPEFQSNWDRFAIEGKMFVVGRVEYRGTDMIGRVTGFCRQYDSNTGRWHAITDAEYEYTY